MSPPPIVESGLEQVRWGRRGQDPEGTVRPPWAWGGRVVGDTENMGLAGAV